MSDNSPYTGSHGDADDELPAPYGTGNGATGRPAEDRRRAAEYGYPAEETGDRWRDRPGLDPSPSLPNAPRAYERGPVPQQPYVPKSPYLPSSGDYPDQYGEARQRRSGEEPRPGDGPTAPEPGRYEDSPFAPPAYQERNRPPQNPAPQRPSPFAPANEPSRRPVEQSPNGLTHRGSNGTVTNGWNGAAPPPAAGRLRPDPSYGGRPADGTDQPYGADQSPYGDQPPYGGDSASSYGVEQSVRAERSPFDQTSSRGDRPPGEPGPGARPPGEPLTGRAGEDLPPAAPPRPGSSTRMPGPDRRSPLGEPTGVPGPGRPDDDPFASYRSPGGRPPERRSPDGRTPDAQGFDSRRTEDRSGEGRAGEGRVGDRRRADERPAYEPTADGRQGDERTAYRAAADSRRGDEQAAHGPVANNRRDDERTAHGPLADSRRDDGRTAYGTAADSRRRDEQAAHGPVANDRRGDEWTTYGTAAEERRAGDRPADGRAADSRRGEDRAAYGQASEGRPGGGRTGGHRPADARGLPGSAENRTGRGAEERMLPGPAAGRAGGAPGEPSRANGRPADGGPAGDYPADPSAEYGSGAPHGRPSGARRRADVQQDAPSQVTADPSTSHRARRAQPGTGDPGDHRSGHGTDRPAGPSANQSSVAQSSPAQPSAAHSSPALYSAAQPQAGHTSATQTPAGHAPAARTPAGHDPAARTAADHDLAAQTPADHDPAAETPAGQTSTGQRSTRQPSTRQLSAGQLSAEQLPAAQPKPGSAPQPSSNTAGRSQPPRDHRSQALGPPQGPGDSPVRAGAGPSGPPPGQAPGDRRRRPPKYRVHHLRDLKHRGEKWAMLTAYDQYTAEIFDQAGIPVLLVGDSAANTVLGYENTLRITVDELIPLARAVASSAPRALVVADLPFGSYQASPEQAFHTAARFLKEAGVQAVKLEGGRVVVPTVEKLTRSGIPVMAHLGFTPQSEHALGGPRVQGRGEHAAELIDDAVALAGAGAFALVLELVPGDLAAEITKRVPIPTIGIGAGKDTDAQVLVWQDLAGLRTGPLPRFVKQYADLRGILTAAATTYAAEVATGAFPSDDHTF